MKTSRLLIVVITLTFILTGCGKKKAVPSRAAKLQDEAHQIELAMQKSVADSQVIVYAKAYTNNAPELLLSILEIWKGENEASNLGITNDSLLPFRWPANLGPLPDDAIIFIPPGTTRSNLQFGAGTTFFQPGKTNGMTAQGYKTWIDKLLPPGAAPHNVIRFTVQVTNNYMKTTDAPVQIVLDSGFLGYIAVTVDDPKYFDDAVWTNYTSANITVPLGATEGWHNVRIGLRGHADTVSAAVWQNQSKRLKLDLTPPQLAITSPKNNTVNVPVIQLQGYSVEALSGINYDMSNAVVVVTNQDVLILDQSYDATIWEFTTTTFEAFNVPLTNGMNVITLHAADLAGNVTTTNFNFTLDYSTKTNPPLVQFLWPTDGMLICGSTVTVRGQVDDPTATVMATVTDTNGNTSTVTGEVESNGRFWLENLPLKGGTNVVAITLSNAVNLSTNITLNLVQSAVTLTINPLGNPSQYWQREASVNGTVSDGSYAVWVNGVTASVSSSTNNLGTFNWSADHVPMSPGGVAIFDLTAYPPGEAPPSNSSGKGANTQSPRAVKGPQTNSTRQP